MIGLVMFAVALLLLLVGFPVAFTFGGVAVFFGLLAEGPDSVDRLAQRAGLPLPRVAATLLRLELEGQVVREGLDRYRR